MPKKADGTGQFIVPDTDRAISDPEDDQYGFVELAQKLAPSVIAATQTDGMVIGVEGKWGSGKTSLLNFLHSELNDQGDQKDIHVISIAPWLQGDENDLAVLLLSQISAALESEVQDSKNKNAPDKTKFKENAKLFKSYAVKVGRGVSPLLKIAGHIVPGVGVAGSVAEGATNYLAEWGSDETTTELKGRIVERLNQSKFRFVVLMDDLDRLEPAQTVEVIRLVRSVADFPKVAYCLCYDRDVLTHALEQGLGVKDGDLYLQKMVQLSFAIPLPEPFDLRGRLKEKLLGFYELLHAREASGELKSKLLDVIDREGGMMEVPRDVALAFNAIKFAYPSIKEDCYFPDVCWIQLIKIKRPKLYRWIEKYLATRTVLVTSTARLNRESRRQTGQELKKLLPAEDLEATESIYRVGQFVSGLEHYAKNHYNNSDKDAGEEVHVFQSSLGNSITEMMALKRIGSPLHSRIYFAFAIPKTVMPDAKFDELRNAAAKDVPKLTNMLSKLAGDWRPVGGTWFSHVMDRLDGGLFNEMEITELKGWAIAISDSMDRVIEEDNERPGLMLDTATETQFRVQRLLRLIRENDADVAHGLIISIFNQSPSMNWLVSDLFRQELFDHGIVGDREKPNDRALTAEEVAKIKTILKTRLKNESVRAAIGNYSNLAGFLYGWRDLAGIRSPKTWVKKYTKEDRNFLRFLSGMKSWVTSDKTYYPLKKDNVERFLDWDLVTQRVDELADNTDDQIASLAGDIQEAIVLSENVRW